MNSKAKAVVLALSFICAAALAATAVISKVSADNCKEATCFQQVDENSYVLRDYEGYVAVFVENDPNCPMTVTDIQISTLRELDQRLLQTGMKVKTHERLVMTLEDLGS